MRIDQLLNGGEALQGQHNYTSLGLLSKTLAPSPIIRWALPARIRHKDKDDIVLIGEDFIRIAQIERDGRLTHVATKADFGCPIVSAKVLGDPIDEDDGDDEDSEDDEDEKSDYDIKREDQETGGSSFPATTRLPPQCLVLVLGSQQLIFMFACESSEGVVDFAMSSTVPLPAFESPPQQLGKHLAIDPKSRAVAVAAAEDNVLLYSAEPINPTSPWGVGFLPVSCERPLVRVRGVIQQMEFLYPPEIDPDHVILLLVVIRDGKTCLVRVDWLHSAGVQSAQKHAPYPISRGSALPNLLIPIVSSAAFILATGPDLLLYTGILTGHTQKPITIALPEPEPKLRGGSSGLPRWVAWARPRRNRVTGHNNNDFLYLAREDGAVYYVVLNRDSPRDGTYTSHVKDFNCHIDSAFTCYGTRKQHDVFAIVGAESQGGVWNIVPLPNLDLDLDSDLVSVLPNWTSTFDLVVSKSNRNLEGSRDALFVPSGRQPYGKLSELRFGTEACATGRFQADMLASVVSLWPLPLEGRDELLVLMTSPTTSRLLQIPRGALLRVSGGDITEADEDNGLDYDHRTLAAAVIAENHVIQITERSISMSHAGRVGVLREMCPVESRITAAAIDEEHGVAITAERRNGQSTVSLFAIQVDGNGATLGRLGDQMCSDKNLVSAAIFKSSIGMFAVFGTSDSLLCFYGLHPDRGPVFVSHHDIPGEAGSLNICDDMTVLVDFSQSGTVSSPSLMLLCGLRDGNLHAFQLTAGRDGRSLSVVTRRSFRLGHTSVKLSLGGPIKMKRFARPQYLAAYAACGNGFYKISWDAAGSGEVTISDIWITDARDPSLQQSAVTAFAVIPPSDFLIPQLASSLILTSGDGAFLTKDEGGPPKVVPRSLTAEGTPIKALKSSNFGCFITVGVESSVHASATNRGSQSRSMRSVVHFRSSGPKAWDFVHRMEPGARVYSMTEWIYRDGSGKKYVYIIVGSGPIDYSSSAKGEVTLLQPRLRDGVVQEVRSHRVKTLETAVYALAPFGKCGLVACTRPWLFLFEYQDGKFAEVCKFRFTSPGIFVTTAPPLIHVSTADDSLITLLHDAQKNQLSSIGTDYGRRKSAHHLTLDVPSILSTTSLSQASLNGRQSIPLTLNIMSTKDCCVVGKQAPSATERSFTTTIPDLFRARLSHCQLRLRKASIRPPWKPESIPGILEDEIIGISAEGTVTGFAILEPQLAHRLRWVQRICERTKRICPMGPRRSFDGGQGDLEDDEITMLPPRGFEGNHVTVQRPSRPEDMHINGDILQRLLDRGGAALLRQLLDEETEKKDRVADWVRENIESQQRLVEDLIVEVRQVLDRWW